MSGIGGALGSAANVLGSVMSIKQSRDYADAADNYYSQLGAATRAQSNISRAQADLAWDQWRRYRRVHGPAEEKAAREYAADIDLYRPLKQAQVRAGLHDISLYQPMKQMAAEEALSSASRYRPLEEIVAGKAAAGVKPEVDRAAGRASANVRSAFSTQREAERRKLSSLGLDPARFSHLDRLSGLEEAAAEAAARTRAAEDERGRAEEATYSRRMAALGLRRDLPSAPYAGSASVPRLGAVSDAAAGRAAGLLSAASGGLSGAAGRYASLASGLQRSAEESLQRGLGLMGEAADRLG